LAHCGALLLMWILTFNTGSYSLRLARYHIAISALKRANRPEIASSVLIQRCRSALDAATAYAHARFEDSPEIQNWIWEDPKN
jgi:phosphoketolase